MTTIIRDILLPIVCAIVTLGCAALTVFLFIRGEIGGALCLLVLTVMSALFVVHDVKRLFFRE